MARLTASILLLVLAAGPVLAAVPSSRMMMDCMTADMSCHNPASLSCCTNSPGTSAMPMAPAGSSASVVGKVAPANVIAVIATATLPSQLRLDASPPHGHRPGDPLLLFATLLI